MRELPQLDGKWSIDARFALVATLTRHLDIADKLAGGPWQLSRRNDGTLTGRLRRGPVQVTLLEEQLKENEQRLRYRLAAKRFGLKVTATCEIECRLSSRASTQIQVKLAFDDSTLLRFVPKSVVQAKLHSLRRSLLETYAEALDALAFDSEAALLDLDERERSLMVEALRGTDTTLRTDATQ